MQKALFRALAECFDDNVSIEARGKEALLNASNHTISTTHLNPLPPSVTAVLLRDDAHPVCKLIAEAEFDWCPPKTSQDPKYIKDSIAKVHVELIGPDGLVKNDLVRLGLYGMQPGYEYGLRTHLADEVFIMLAGEADWKTGEGEYVPLRTGERSYHPSMMPHANRTRDQAFMSVYIWDGNVSTDSYIYQGRY